MIMKCVNTRKNKEQDEVQKQVIKLLQDDMADYK